MVDKEMTPQLPPPLSPLEFHVLLILAPAQLYGYAIKKGVEINCGDVPEVSPDTDPKLFRQVMFNLLSNAIKFTPSGGKVSIQVRCLTAEELRNEPVSRAIVALADPG